MPTVKRFLALDGSNRWLVIRAYVWLALIHVGLRAFGLQPLVARAGTTPMTRETGPPAMQTARRYARCIDSVARHHPLRPACLQRSLVLHLWLRREGVPSELRIGVRKETGQLRAHAWVELMGHAVNEHNRVVSAFTPLTEIPHGVGTAMASK